MGLPRGPGRCPGGCGVEARPPLPSLQGGLEEKQGRASWFQGEELEEGRSGLVGVGVSRDGRCR